MTKPWILSLLVSVAVAGCTSERTDPRSGQQTAEPAAIVLPAGLTRVADASQVCMVNDQFMGKPQIPVQVGGKTYYGCCAMCEEKLNKQPEARLAKDPVTGQEVDKATAVMVQDAQGKILYFSSEDTLRKFKS